MDTTHLFSLILIGTPDAQFARMARSVLQNAGYVARVVDRGAAVLAALDVSSPDLILLDTALPDMTGHEVARAVKASTSRLFVPVIMVVDGASRDAAAALNAGADEVLQQPVTAAELLARVWAMLRLKRATDAMAELNASLERKVAERTASLEQAQSVLRHTEKLSALGRLAATIVHDINNPLTGILGAFYFVREWLPAGSVALQTVEMAEHQVSLISGLVDQLRLFSKPPQTERYPLSLAGVVDEVLLLTRHDLERRGITVTTDFAPEERPVVAARDQLIEVFMNLVVNARDAMPRGGQLDVTSKQMRGCQVVTVSDTGVGIPESEHERVFEPFFTTKGDEGTGLGLAICYRVVQEHGGEIKFESEVGHGTVFTVCLPIHDEGGRSHVGADIV